MTIAIQICDVLAEAHQLGIIHRDLKPSNIMLNERGVCVLDFGVAKVLASTADATTSQASTGSGQIIGTPRYMSPEQCLGQRVGAQSDLYSLGVVLYEMLAGRPPFIDHLPSVVLVKQATTAPPPLPQLRSDLPRSLALAVHSLMAKRPEDRPQSAAAARTLFEKILSRPPEPAEQESHEMAPEVEPFSLTLAATSYSRAAIFRIAAPVVLVSIMGALLLVLGYGGSAAEMAVPAKLTADIPERLAVNPGSPRSNQPENQSHTALSSLKPITTGLSIDQARKIVTPASHGALGDLAVVQTAVGPAVVAIHDESKAGKTHFFVMERRGSGYRITDRGPLDVENFRGRKWTAERVDAGGDGRNQVLFSGISTNLRDLRLVLYDPGTRQSYSLRIQTDGRSDQTRLMQWSENTADSRLAAFRVVLREKARTMLSSGMRG